MQNGKKSILLVDDEMPFLLSLSEGLQFSEEDISVHIAANGKKAVEVLCSEHLDLVITDLKMPEMDGFELMDYMREHFPLIPVIVMTAYDVPGLQGKLAQDQVHSFIEKPLDLDGLTGRIRDALGRSGGGGYPVFEMENLFGDNVFPPAKWFALKKHVRFF